VSSPQNGAPGEPSQATTPLPFVWSLDRSSDVGRALLAAARRLKETGSDSPQLDSAILMAHVLGVSKGWLYAHPNRQLTPDEIARFEELVRRRMRCEPVAYLVGFKPFYGLDITVDRRVLIPRPETEILVDRVLEHLQNRTEERVVLKVADVGAGSGAIAVALAVNVPNLVVYATDISEEALKVAAQNVWRYGVGDQVQLIPGHLLNAVPEPVDIIVANLPYVASADLANLSPQVRDYEPFLALDGGVDGLEVFRSFFAALGGPRGSLVLRLGGRIFLEIGWNQGDAVRSMAKEAFPGANVAVLVDYAGLDRIVLVTT
jgi:release factor glutamine methyltransferase